METRFTVRLGDDLALALDGLARLHERTRSEELRRVLRSALAAELRSLHDEAAGATAARRQTIGTGDGAYAA
jgi:predicted transcriptional regulator